MMYIICSMMADIIENEVQKVFDKKENALKHMESVKDKNNMGIRIVGANCERCKMTCSFSYTNAHQAIICDECKNKPVVKVKPNKAWKRIEKAFKKFGKFLKKFLKKRVDNLRGM